MSYEPRMRGRRYLRSPSKKPSKKVKESENAQYLAVKEVDPSEVVLSVLNAIDHLGNQRFVLPPFAEHFKRWLNDLKSVLDEFETQIPQAADPAIHNEFTKTMNEVQNVLTKYSELENTQSDDATKLQQELARRETELSQLEYAYRTQTQELRRKYEKSDQKLRAEIDRLDRRRMQILRENAGIFRRIFRKPETAIREASSALETRKTELIDSQRSLSNGLQRRRDEYTVKHRELVTEIESLRKKVRELNERDRDNTLESRREACLRLHAVIAEAMQKAQSGGEAVNPPSNP